MRRRAVAGPRPGSAQRLHGSRPCQACLLPAPPSWHTSRLPALPHPADPASGLVRRDGGEEGGQQLTTLFVGDLPPSWATPDLANFFACEFGEVLEARVIGDQVGGGRGAAGAARGWAAHRRLVGTDA